MFLDAKEGINNLIPVEFPTCEGTHELLQIYTKLPYALELLKNAKDGEKLALAFDAAFPGYEKGIFEFVQKNRVAAQHYHAFQSGKVQTSRWSQRNIAESWDWAAVGTGTIVDVPRYVF